jgi:pyruvate,water dikinase
VVLLQSRPITGLPPAPVALADAEHPVLGYPDRIREMIPSAVTPLLGELAFQVVMPTILEAVSRHGFMPPALAARATEGAHIVRGRLYLDLDMVTSWVAPGLDALAVVELIETGRRPPLSALRMSAVAPLLLKLPAVVFRLLPMLGRLEAASQEVSRILDNIFEELGGDVREWEHGKLVGVLRLQPEATFRERLFAAPPANALARMCGPTAFTALGWMASRWAGEPAGSIAATLVAGEPRMPEVQCAIALWDLAEAARAVPAVAQALATDPATALERLPDDPAAAAWRRRFDEFLARFGHRAIEEVELGRPRWRERPAYPLSVIAGYLRGSAEASPRAVQARRHREREAAEARVLARLRRRPLRRFLFRRALVAARETALASESSKSDIMRLFWLWRVAALELGRRLAAAGRLEAAEDVFFLHLDELEDDGPDLRATVAARREDHGRWQREQPPRLLDARGRGVREGLHRRAALADGALAGTPTSPGLARGPVRVVLDPAGGVDLAPGDVLVAPFTDPAWTPLFYTAVAAVVEVGSLLSHASIVAREAGIPSVVGIPGVTSLLRDGERVEVDGTRGTVRFLDRIGAEPA